MGKSEKIMEQFEKLSQDKKDRIVKHHLEKLEQEAEDIKNRELDLIEQRNRLEAAQLVDANPNNDEVKDRKY